MPSTNPTQTRGIEKRWLKEINRRWARFTRAIIGELKVMNDASLAVSRLDAPRILGNAALGIDASQARIYMDFVQTQINLLLMETPQSPNWQAKYQVESYKKSLDMFSAQLRIQGESALATTFEQQAATLLSPFTATPSIGAVAVAASPIHRDALEFVFTRGYDSLDNWTSKLQTEVRQIVFDSISTGEGFEHTSKQIRLRTEVSKSRAKLIAQTEVNQAYGIAQINEARRTEEILEEPVQLRWLTKRDGKVRDLHAKWHGTVTSPDETQRRKNVSPYNCRCGLALVVKGANTQAKVEKFKKERDELLALEAKDKKNKTTVENAIQFAHRPYMATLDNEPLASIVQSNEVFH